MKSPKVFAVVPTFNRKEKLRSFLNCWNKQDYANRQLIIVDDGSNDGTDQVIAELAPHARHVIGNGELWWTGSVNRGIKEALVDCQKGDALLLLNDDLEFGPDLITTLVRQLKRNPRSIIGSLLVDADRPETILDGGICVNWWTAKFSVLNEGKRVDQFERNTIVEVSTLTGRGVLFPIEVYQEVGLYDDEHFKQCGDTELPARAKNKGYRLLVSYDARVSTHLESTDGINVQHQYRLSDLKKYYFDIKSNSRLVYRLFLGWNTRQNPLQFVSYMTFDLTRVTGHFVKRLKL